MRGYLLLTLLIIVFGGSLFIFGRSVTRGPETPPQNVVPANTSLPSLTEPRVTVIDPVRGDPNAPVTIVEFGDYFCAFCATIEPVLRDVLAAYPEKVRLVWKDFPNDYLHPNASGAAEAARCAGELGAYWEYHDALFSRTAITTTTLIAYEDLAATLGLPRTAFQSCLDSDRMQPRIQTTSLEAQALDLPGVPFFFINGEPFHGTTLEEFKTAINALLK